MGKYTEKAQIDALLNELDQEIASPKKKKGIGKIIGQVLFYVATILLAVILIDISIDKREGKVPSAFGMSFYEIVSESMEPTLGVGSILVSKTFTEDTVIKVGDIVTFQMLDGRIVTHRIVEVIGEGKTASYRTKGDNPANSVDAEILTRDRILAVFLFKLPLT
jgi:signal peptidase